jgi:hypothetical protein
MVVDSGLEVAPFPMRSNLVELFATTEAGREAKKGGFSGLSKMIAFLGPLLKDIFDDTLRAVKELKADVVVLTTFPFMAGGLAIPEIVAKEGLKTRAVVANTVPLSKTSEFAVPLAGMGLTMTFGFMNSFMWKTSEYVGVNQMYGPIIEPYLKELGVTKSPKELIAYSANRKTVPPTPIAYIYSPCLVPKPPDWTSAEIVWVLSGEVPSSAPTHTSRSS